MVLLYALNGEELLEVDEYTTSLSTMRLLLANMLNDISYYDFVRRKRTKR